MLQTHIGSMSPSWKLTACLLALSVVFGISGCATAPPLSSTDQGFAALEAGDWRSAKSHFALSLREDASDGRAWHGQSLAQLAGRDPEAALRSLSSLAKVDGARFDGEARGTYGDALESAARHRLRNEQFEAALAAARALGRVEPKRRGIKRLFGQALVGEASRRRFVGDKDTALTLFQQACHTAPGELEAWVGAAEILLEQKKGKQAMQLLEAARKRHPTAGAIRTLSLQALHER